VIRSVPKTIITAQNNVIKINPEQKVSRSKRELVNQSLNNLPQESPETSNLQSGTQTVQKIITSSGQVIHQQMQSGSIITSANLQQLLQRGNIAPGQKILVQNPGGTVQKLLVTSSSASPQQQMQQTGEKRIIIQNAAGQQQQIIVQQQQQQQPTQQIVTIGGQKILLQSSSNQGQQQIKTITGSVQQPIQFQLQESPKPQQQQQQQQIVIQSNGSNIAQQLQQGKLQLMNVNGQQVLVRSVNQPVILNQMKPNQSPQLTPVKQTIQQIVTSTPNQQIVKTVQMPSLVSTGSGEMSIAEQQSLLLGHPPGTVIKSVTAQVMQTANGPRIVLQGLQGNDFTPHQTQQQVKQQLMKGELID